MTEPTSNTPPVKPTSSEIFAAFLRDMGPHELGDGDPALGLSVLVAMCVTLAQLAAPFGAVETPVCRLPMALNLLSVDPVVSAAIERQVIAPVLAIQRNAIQNLGFRDLSMLGFFRTGLPPEATSRGQKYGFVKKSFIENESLRHEILKCDDQAVRFESLERAVVLAPASTIKSLNEAVPLANRGHLLGVIDLQTIEQVAPMESILCGYAEGLTQGKKGIFTIPSPLRCSYIASVPPAVAATLCSGYTAASWPWKSVWLDRGMKVPGPLPPRTEQGLHFAELERRYVAAVKLLLGQRYTSHDPIVVTTPESRAFREGRKANLSRVCEGMPALQAAADPLFAALSFGMTLLLGRVVGPLDCGLVQMCSMVTPRVAEIVARRVTRRSRRIMETLRTEHENHAQRKWADLVRQRLTDDPQTVRDLCRRFNRLSAGQCRDALQLLLQDGVADVRDDRWVHCHTVEAETAEQSDA